MAAQDVGARVLAPANPLIAVGAGPRRERSLNGGGVVDRGIQWNAHIEQTLEIAGQRGTRREEVAREVAVASWREVGARAETRARVRAIYVGAQLAQAQLRAAQRRAELVQQLVDGVRTRVDTGAASAVDLELARIERGRVNRERTSAELSLAIALSDLRVLLAFEPGTELELSTPLGSPAPKSEPLARLIERGREHRAEMQGLAASHSAMDAEITRLRREAVPNPTLFLDVQRDLPGQLYFGGGIALPLPVWRRNQGELALARSERGRIEQERELVAREIGSEVERAYRAVTSFAELVRLSETEILPAADAAVELITQGWRAGKFDLFRLIQASREAGEARRSYLENLGLLWSASIDLDRALGAP